MGILVDSDRRGHLMQIHRIMSLVAEYTQSLNESAEKTVYAQHTDSYILVLFTFYK